MYFGISDFDWAEWSNLLVYASMLVWTLAFISFALSFSSGRVTSSERRDALVGAGAPIPETVTLTDADLDVREQRASRQANIGMSLTWLATVLLLGGIIARGLSVHRWPLGNMYEFSIAAGFGVAAVYLVLARRHDLRWLGVAVAASVLLDLGLAVTVLYTESAPLVPALDSYWLIIHVGAAVISGGAFSVGAAMTGLYLIVDRAERSAAAGKTGGFAQAIAARVPSSHRIDLIAYRVHAFVFPLWTFAVIAGAIWAEAAWSRYWGWDPKETWAFITWIAYAAYLHARVTAGWRGRKAAVIALIGFAAFLFNYFGVNLLLPGLHSYAGL